MPALFRKACASAGLADTNARRSGPMSQMEIGTPAWAVSRDQLAYANKTFLEMHARNQSFFLKRPEIVDILENLADVAKVVTRDMAAAGVGILAGCDAMIAGFCVHDELATMVAGGMTPAAALQTATVESGALSWT